MKWLRLVLKLLPFVLGVVVLVLVVFWLSGFFTERVAPAQVNTELPRFDPTKETLEPVEVVIKPVIEEVVGTVKARERTTVSARIMSTI
ncbi:MAG TPA: hypothetical protein PL064_09710, partial [Thermogutta sp.]|nr:hypothetical protein [Thermogutta sp.]